MSIITTTGIHLDVTPDQYFAEPCPAPALTSSGIKLLSPVGAAPAKFAHHHPAIGQPAEERKSSAAQYRGKLVHRLALDKGDDYEISPFDDYRSKDARAWREATEAAGLMPVKQKDFDQAEAMASVIRSRIDEACKGKPYVTEVVIAWQEQMSQGPVWCRAMLDVWCPDLLLALDVKTCADASDEAVQRAFANGYATQDSWYRRGIEAIVGQPGRAQFKFLFVESDPPHLSREATARESLRHIGRFNCDRALAIFADCLSRNEWPGYEPLAVEPTSWLSRQMIEAELEEAA